MKRDWNASQKRQEPKQPPMDADKRRDLEITPMLSLFETGVDLGSSAVHGYL
jgi:hypothetical protein